MFVCCTYIIYNILQAPVEVRTKHRGVGTTAWNAPVTSKSEKAGPGSEKNDQI